MSGGYVCVACPMLPVHLALISALAGALAAAGPASLYSDSTPPVRYRRDTTVQLQVTDQEGIEQACHPVFGPPPAGMKTDACEIDGRIVAPNPCRFPDSDAYAHLLCHELGHANGWPATHGA